MLQRAMGWRNGHRHEFEADGVLYGTPRHPELGRIRASERKTRLAEVVQRPEQRLVYRYDFFDRWEHDVVVEAVLAPDRAVKDAQVLAGNGPVRPRRWAVSRAMQNSFEWVQTPCASRRRAGACGSVADLIQSPSI